MTSQYTNHAAPLPTPTIETPRHLEATVNIEQVRAMPEHTAEQIAAKWLAAKTIETAGDSAKSIRSHMGNLLSVHGGMGHEDRITVNGNRYKFSVSQGTSSGVTIAAINAVKARYARLPYIGRAIDQAVEANKTSYTTRKLTLG